jgi:putative PIN family toxin of toxin-antitoxin system
MKRPRIVLDTNVLVAALRSRRGASFLLLEQVGSNMFELAVSVPLVLEYEDVLVRHRRETGLGPRDIATIVDYLCSVAHRQDIFYLWRPLLRDPKDDLVLELAVAAGCEGIVTFNLRDFDEARRFGKWVLTPREFLRRIGVLS